MVQDQKGWYKISFHHYNYSRNMLSKLGKLPLSNYLWYLASFWRPNEIKENPSAAPRWMKYWLYPAPQSEIIPAGSSYIVFVCIPGAAHGFCYLLPQSLLPSGTYNWHKSGIEYFVLTNSMLLATKPRYKRHCTFASQHGSQCAIPLVGCWFTCNGSKLVNPLIPPQPIARIQYTRWV